MAEAFKIAIVGSGPSGLSAAAHAAELGVSHVLLESEQHAADTIYKYQKGKYVMAEPSILPLRSPITFAAGTREQILGAWNEGLAKYKVNLKKGAGVTAITGQKGAFALRLASGETIGAEHVILAIGLQGNLRKIGVPGEDLGIVQYQLDDPKEYEDETIVVVGAGDAAIENALALAEQNRVILINRNEEFARCKEGNLTLVLAAIKDGKIECRYRTSPASVEMVETDGAPARFNAKTPDGAEIIGCHRVIARLGAIPPRKLVESFGVRFPNADPAAVPQLSDTYESNVPGLYIVGALGGYPLIKQAMNQGYEVVEYVRGNRVEPADEPLLKAKFANYKRARTVGDGLALLQKNVPLLAGITTLQLREFLLDSDIRTPKPGEIVFKRNDYTNTFYSIVEGEVGVELNGGTPEARWIVLRPGDFFGELSLISGRRRAATIKAGHDCVLVETPRRSMLKLIASVDSVRRAIDAAFLKRAVRAYLTQDLPDDRPRHSDRGRATQILRDRRNAVRGRRRRRRALPDTPRFSDRVAKDRRQGCRAVLCRRRQLRRRDGAAFRRAADGHGEGCRGYRSDRARRRDASRRWSRGTRSCARRSRGASSTASAPTCRWNRRANPATSSATCCSRASARRPTCC